MMDMTRFPYYDLEATLWMPTGETTGTGVPLLVAKGQPGYQVASLLAQVAQAATLPREPGASVTLTVTAVEAP